MATSLRTKRRIFNLNRISLSMLNKASNFDHKYDISFFRTQYNLLNNLANVSTIQILHVHEARFGTRLIQNSKTKNEKRKTTHLFPGPARVIATFRNSIRIRPISRNNRTAGFHTFPLTQSVRHMCRKHKAFRRMYREQCH